MSTCEFQLREYSVLVLQVFVPETYSEIWCLGAYVVAR